MWANQALPPNGGCASSWGGRFGLQHVGVEGVPCVKDARFTRVAVYFALQIAFNQQARDRGGPIAPRTGMLDAICGFSLGAKAMNTL